MKFDRLGLIISEGCEGVGQLGDSMAESSRYAMLCQMFDQSKIYGLGNIPDLALFEKPNGWTRHPDLEKQGIWVNDIPSDQLLPWFIAENLDGKMLVLDYLDHSADKTPNGDLITPMFFAAIYRAKNKPSIIADLSILGQAYLFKFPFRWSDSKKWFEKSSGSGCDVLNWLMCIFQAYQTNTFTWPIRKAMKVMSTKDVINLVKIAYLEEPNAFVVPLYETLVAKLWT